ncbi:unnamed protein product [Orchesella dallaii]|uniref:Uncharacterized protein n=1 Tax=Orchesella dallaii TaxID=48710 RepID=A0ABP1RAY2_9HEXA
MYRIQPFADRRLISRRPVEGSVPGEFVSAECLLRGMDLVDVQAREPKPMSHNDQELNCARMKVTLVAKLLEIRQEQEAIVVCQREREIILGKRIKEIRKLITECPLWGKDQVDVFKLLDLNQELDAMEARDWIDKAMYKQYMEKTNIQLQELETKIKRLESQLLEGEDNEVEETRKINEDCTQQQEINWEITKAEETEEADLISFDDEFTPYSSVGGDDKEDCVHPQDENCECTDAQETEEADLISFDDEFMPYSSDQDGDGSDSISWTDSIEQQVNNNCEDLTMPLNPTLSSEVCDEPKSILPIPLESSSEYRTPSSVERPAMLNASHPQSIVEEEPTKCQDDEANYSRSSEEMQEPCTKHMEEPGCPESLLAKRKGKRNVNTLYLQLDDQTTIIHAKTIANETGDDNTTKTKLKLPLDELDQLGLATRTSLKMESLLADILPHGRGPDGYLKLDCAAILYGRGMKTLATMESLSSFQTRTSLALVDKFESRFLLDKLASRILSSVLECCNLVATLGGVCYRRVYGLFRFTEFSG